MALERAPQNPVVVFVRHIVCFELSPLRNRPMPMSSMALSGCAVASAIEHMIERVFLMIITVVRRPHTSNRVPNAAAPV